MEYGREYKSLDHDADHLDRDATDPGRHDIHLDQGTKQLMHDDDQVNHNIKQRDHEVYQFSYSNKQPDQEYKQLDQENKQLDQENKQLYQENKLDHDANQLEHDSNTLGQWHKQLEHDITHFDRDAIQLDQENKELNKENKELDQENTEQAQTNKHPEHDVNSLDHDSLQLDHRDTQMEQVDHQDFEYNIQSIETDNSEIPFSTCKTNDGSPQEVTTLLRRQARPRTGRHRDGKTSATSTISTKRRRQKIRFKGVCAYYACYFVFVAAIGFLFLGTLLVLHFLRCLAFNEGPLYACFINLRLGPDASRAHRSTWRPRAPPAGSN